MFESRQQRLQGLGCVVLDAAGLVEHDSPKGLRIELVQPVIVRDDDALAHGFGLLAAVFDLDANL